MGLKKIVGLYLNKTKNGDPYFSGKTKEGVKYFVFKETDRKSDKHPDYVLSVEEKEDNGFEGSSDDVNF